MRYERLLRAVTIALLVGAPVVSPRAQEGRGLRLRTALGIGGQQDGDSDLGAGGLTADVGVTWLLGARVRSRLDVAAYAIPLGQGCTCDPGDPPLGVQAAYGFHVVLQSVPRRSPYYALAGIGYRWGGFHELNEHESTVVLAGLGWSLGATRRASLELRYEHLLSRLGGTRALLPLQFAWRL